MACSSVNIVTASDFILTNSCGYCGLGRSFSAGKSCKRAPFRRSYSDNTLVKPLSSRPSSCTRTHVLNTGHSLGNIFSQWSSPAHLFGTEHENFTKLIVECESEEDKTKLREGKDEKVNEVNWIARLVELRTRWKGKQEKEVTCEHEGGLEECEDGCSVDYGEDTSFDAESFSRLLVQVTWSDAKRFSKLANLCSMAYTISEINGDDLRLNHGLQIVTSSLEKKAEAIAVKARLDKDSTHLEGESLAILESNSKTPVSKQNHTVRSSVAYEIAASAASHVQCHTKNENYSCKCGGVAMNDDKCPLKRECNSGRAAQMAASTMTAVVAARDREKDQVSKELQSLHSSPCEWFICDDPATNVRYIVIQGSESLASWQANLFFEPTNFEETDALVHRGIYEAAKGIYKQVLPEIQNHISTHRDNAKLQFTGHSLGGSLSLLLHLMLIGRGTVKPSALLPVATFGSPYIFCGGDKIFEQLGIKESMAQCVILHRDIVPRAFSCNYPRQVAQVLKHLNGSFRSHPCLNKNKMLYSPVGKTFILQPSEELSPSHPMLPSGCGLYSFDNAQIKTTTTALRTFLNTPHPLETLSSPTAYGSEGTIIRDHDSNNYLEAVNSVLKQYTKLAFQKVRHKRRLEPPSMTSSPHKAWTHEGNFESATARKAVMSGV
ncbi:hypothetical protein vseg_004510 [Gypsophila vaccaria]